MIDNSVNEIKILDKGHVKLIDFMGSDQSIESAARISYDKGTRKISDTRNLLRYLIRNKHTSPFEMAEVIFELKLPLFVIQQLLRHRTANVNQMSLRYSEAIDEFYIPDLEHIKPQSQTNKQGRGGILSKIECVRAQNIIQRVSSEIYNEYKTLIGKNEGNYNISESTGIARELARIILPHSNYSKLVWKCDLHNLMHLLKLRTDAHAQHEIRVMADAIYKLVQPKFPIAIEAWVDYVRDSVNVSRMEHLLLKDLLSGKSLQQLMADFDSINAFLEHYGLGKREFEEFRSTWQM